jgi:hypothetical protein
LASWRTNEVVAEARSVRLFIVRVTLIRDISQLIEFQVELAVDHPIQGSAFLPGLVSRGRLT